MDDLFLKVPSLLRSTARRQEADATCEGGDFSKAINKYLEALHFILDVDAGDTETVVVLPLPTFLTERYLAVGNDALGYNSGFFLEFVTCCSSIAYCYDRLGDYVKMIDWTEEAMQMYEAQKLMLRLDTPSWKYHEVIVLEYFMSRIEFSMRAHDRLKALGNTSLGATYGARAMNDYSKASSATDSSTHSELKTWGKKLYPGNLFGLRHPEPSLIHKDLTYPSMQVRGVWEKLSYSPGLKPSGRCVFSSWIWRNKLYVAGGVTEKQLELKDIWSMDLSTMTWHRLPDIPTQVVIFGLSSIRPMRVWKDKAYLFIGTPKLHVFDLVHEKWTILTTSLARAGGRIWPYWDSGKDFTGFSFALLDDKLYTMAGDDGNTSLGVIILMVLNLTTNKWEHLSGTSDNIPKMDEPNLRTLSLMWSIPSQRKLYLMYGSATRSLARQRHKAHGAETDFPYEDFWSYDVDKKKWTRERRRGDFPSPRSEAACAYNPAIGRAVVYGGYHGCQWSADMSGDYQTGRNIFDFSFFGDTFVFDPETELWQHVLVKGFPSYRGMSSIVCDPDTGKTYLFGGYTNSDYVPSKDLTAFSTMSGN